MRPSTSTTASATGTHASPSPPLPHGSSISHLLRGVLQSVEKRRRRSKREKFLRAVEKSGVDFASALLLSSRISSISSDTRASSLSLSNNSRVVSQMAAQGLDRVEKLQVRATVENVRESVTLVTIQLVLTPVHREAPLPPQQQQLVVGKSAVLVITTGLHPQQQRVHKLTRPFDDFRRLRKMLAFCVRPGRHEDEEDEEEGAKPASCAYCNDVRTYVAQCWERPPLLETSVLSSMGVIRKGVLGSSLLHFVRLARTLPAFPPQGFHDGGGGANGANVANVAPACCGAHCEIATILHDFFRLQQCSTQ